jgi:excisionase family DNA binding protein
VLQSTQVRPWPYSVQPADLQSIPPVRLARHVGFEPTTFGSGASNVRLVGSSKASQRVESVRVGAEGRVPPSRGFARFSSPFAASLLQTLRGGAAPPRVAARLLKVAEVAERMGVSTATVYALCKRGALQHVRVANAIRVPEAALGAFLG